MQNCFNYDVTLPLSTGFVQYREEHLPNHKPLVGMSIYLIDNMYKPFLARMLGRLINKLKELLRYILQCTDWHNWQIYSNFRVFSQHYLLQTIHRRQKHSFRSWWKRRPSTPRWTGWPASSTSCPTKTPTTSSTRGRITSTTSCTLSTRPHIWLTRKKCCTSLPIETSHSPPSTPHHTHIWP